MSFLSLNKKTKIILIALLVSISLGLGLILSFFVTNMVPSKDTHAEETKEKSQRQEEDDTEKQPVPQETKEVQIEEVPEEPPESDPPEEPSIDQSEGRMVYEVGKDIKSGIYKLVAQDDAAYYRISKSKDIESTLNIVQEDVILESIYIKLEKGQYLLLIDASYIEESEIQSYDPKNNTYVSGEYRVGQDIPPGTYTINPKGEVGYVQIASSPLKKDVIESQYIDKPIKITLMKGQFVRISMSDVVIEN